MGCGAAQWTLRLQELRLHCEALTHCSLPSGHVTTLLQVFKARTFSDCIELLIYFLESRSIKVEVALCQSF